MTSCAIMMKDVYKRQGKEDWERWIVLVRGNLSSMVTEESIFLQSILEWIEKMCIRDRPVVIQDQVLGELTLDKDYDAFEGEIQWCGKDVSLSLEVNAESKPSWTLSLIHI